eukprot:1702685-Pyramimonas_sp.AAC.1
MGLASCIHRHRARNNRRCQSLRYYKIVERAPFPLVCRTGRRRGSDDTASKLTRPSKTTQERRRCIPISSDQKGEWRRMQELPQTTQQLGSVCPKGVRGRRIY